MKLRVLPSAITWMALALALGTTTSSTAEPSGNLEVDLWLNGSDLASASGQALLDLAPADLVPREAEAEPWEIVVYLDQTLSRSRSLHQAADLLIGKAEALVGLGDVRIVQADPEPSLSLPATRDQATLETALYDVLFRTRGRDQVRRMRIAYVREERNAEERQLAADEEWDLLASQSDELVSFLAEQGAPRRPRLLLLSQEFLGLDPQTFFRIGSRDGRRAADRLATLRDAAAAFGWALAPILLPESAGSNRLDFARSVDVPVGVTVRFGRDETPEEEKPPTDSELGLARAAPGEIQEAARPSGGELVDSAAALDRLLAELSDRRGARLAFPDERLGELLPLRLPGHEEERLVGAAPPPSVGAVRLRRFLDSLGAQGEIDVSSVVASEASKEPDGRNDYLVQADLSALSLTAATRLRVSTGLQLADGRLQVHQEEISARVTDFDELWTYRGSLDLPAATDVVAVVVEEMSEGRWGGTFANFVPSLPSLEEDDTLDLDRLKPKSRLVTLDALPAETRKRRIEVRARAEEEVARVVFTLDGDVVADLAERPFETSLKIPHGGRGHVVEVIAYDGEGQEIDRDVSVLNAPAEAFWVRIVEPTSGEQVGPVDVAAEVRVPEGSRLERLDFYWNDRLIATSRQPPHRRRILVPFHKPEGFIRVVAQLTDGRQTDDLVLMNSGQFREHVEVEIVELLVVVTDESGEPVRGLDGPDFRVIEDGVEQKVEAFAAAGDLPLTVGLAIDSSLSLFKRFPQVQKAARGFVESLRDDRDRAFLVGFGSEPRLVQETTEKLQLVEAGLELLEPSGLTLVWEGIVLSLRELEPGDGRKALVVFYDGDDEDEKSSYRTALELAEKQGTPIYLIVMNNAAARTGGKSFRTRSFTKRLDDIARAGGGRVYYVTSSGDLSEIFERIGEELRSHYRLTYTPRADDGAQRWREIEVEMRQRGLDARTIAGYEPGLPR